MGMMLAVGFWLVALAPNYGALLVLGSFIGAGRSGVMLVNQSIMMSHTKPEYFGRVMSFVMMGFGLQSLLGPVWGLTADAIGGRQTFALIGVIAAVATVLMAVGWLRTRHLPLEPGTAAASMGRRPGVSVERPIPRLEPLTNGRRPQPAFAEQLAPVALMEAQKARS